MRGKSREAARSPLCGTQQIHAGSCITAHREFMSHCVYRLRCERRLSPPPSRSGTESKKPVSNAHPQRGPWFSTHVRVRKPALLTPQRPLLHPSPGFHRHRTSHNLTHAPLASCSRMRIPPHTFMQRKEFFTLSRSIEKVTRRQASIHRPRHGGTRVNTPSRGEQFWWLHAER